MYLINRKKLVAAFLSCMLLFSWSLVSAGAAETPGSDIVMPRVAGNLNNSFPAKLISPITQPFSAAKGDTIKYDCTYTPKSASVDFGFIAPDGLFYSLNSTSGSINKSIEVSQTGQFTLAIRNNESYAVTVTGTVRY